MHHFVKQEIELQYSQFIGGTPHHARGSVKKGNSHESFYEFWMIPNFHTTASSFHCVLYWFFSHIFIDMEQRAEKSSTQMVEKWDHFSAQLQAPSTLWFAHNYLTFVPFLWHDPHWSQLDNMTGKRHWLFSAKGRLLFMDGNVNLWKTCNNTCFHIVRFHWAIGQLHVLCVKPWLFFCHSIPPLKWDYVFLYRVLMKCLFVAFCSHWARASGNLSVAVKVKNLVTLFRFLISLSCQNGRNGRMHGRWIDNIWLNQ